MSLLHLKCVELFTFSKIPLKGAVHDLRQVSAFKVGGSPDCFYKTFLNVVGLPSAFAGGVGRAHEGLLTLAPPVKHLL